MRRALAAALVQPNKRESLIMSLERKASPEYLEAVTMLKRYIRLERLPGGYWTYSGVKMERVKVGEHASYDRPVWYTTTPIVRSIIEKGRGEMKGDKLVLIPAHEKAE